MRIRRIGGVLAAFWLAISIAAIAQSGLLYLNEEPLSLVHPVLRQGTSILVPLEEFGARIGLEVSSHDGEIVLRGAGFRQAFEEATFHIQDGTAYALLDWVLELVDGEIHYVRGDVYIQTERSEIAEIEVSSQQVTVRLSGFSSHVEELSRQGLSDILLVRLPHTQLRTEAQLIRVGESDIQDVQIVGSSGGTELSISLEHGTVLAIEQLETDDFYVLTIRVVETALHKSVIELSDGITVHEWTDALAERTVNYVYVESWRDRFRVAPAVSLGGYQSVAGLDAILKENLAVAAISVDCPWDSLFPECLIMYGVPCLVPDVPSEVLAIDLFGRWTTFSSLCSVDIKHAGKLIPVDGVNRSLAYGEVVAYAPGYGGSIARGIPGSFTAIKIRENRVVSVYQGPFVSEDPSAILLVASGEAKAVLSSIQLGDPIELVCEFLHAEGTYPHAFSAGPPILCDGIAALSEDQLDELSGFAGGTVLASDWQGGLYLLAFAGFDCEDPGLTPWSLLDTLYSLPTVLRDAVLLSSCGRNAIGYTSASGTFILGSNDPIRLALGLIPIAP